MPIKSGVGWGKGKGGADAALLLMFESLTVHTFRRTFIMLMNIKKSHLPYARLVYFLPHFFAAVYIVEWLLLQTIYVLKKEILQFLGLKSAVYN